MLDSTEKRLVDLEELARPDRYIELEECLTKLFEGFRLHVHISLQTDHRVVFSAPP